MDDIKPSYFAILDADVRYDSTISSTAKLIYAEITALTQKEGYAWATNKYFATNFSISGSQVSRIISQLSDKGYINIRILDEYRREITLSRVIHTPTQKPQGGYAKTAR